MTIKIIFGNLNDLQVLGDNIPSDKVIILGDFYTRIGNKPELGIQLMKT